MIGIFAPTTSSLPSQRRLSRGFTLLEILIAIVIMVGSLMVILPNINRKQNVIKKHLRRLTALNRTLYRFSRIHNKVYRLAFWTDIKEPYYWVEVKHKTPTPIIENPSFPFVKEDLFFKLDESITSQPQLLSEGMYFQKNVNEVSSNDKYIYIYYDPLTVSKPQSVVIRRKDVIWLLKFNPFIGELTIEDDEDEKSKT